MCKIIYKNGFTISHSPFSTKESESKELQRFKGGWCIFQSLQLPLFQACSSEISSFHRCSKCLDLGEKSFFIPSFPLFFCNLFSLSIWKSSSFVKASKRVSYAVLSAKPFCYLKYRPRQLFSLVISISIFHNDSIKVFRCNVIKTDKWQSWLNIFNQVPLEMSFFVCVLYFCSRGDYHNNWKSCWCVIYATGVHLKKLILGCVLEMTMK